MKAKSPKLAKVLTVSWAVEAFTKCAEGIAHLGGYLEHRSKTPIGIQVLWCVYAFWFVECDRVFGMMSSIIIVRSLSDNIEFLSNAKYLESSGG
ncbi:hypothetical protein HCG51_25390 [Tolypothrix sp. PCC 7910]|uniref:hypothetical protein n=1 Tax=Tolypothrix sp. PCC 7910 TaxID=2099387 RepID=UPI0014279951|nr:hypothetical protein [Tolypothrix sp. PCC 7910]QIR39715.1 hypothetical protein HCG51_25390 [Tolypothrix sp. PCC 7910]